MPSTNLARIRRSLSVCLCLLYPRHVTRFCFSVFLFVSCFVRLCLSVCLSVCLQSLTLFKTMWKTERKRLFPEDQCCSQVQSKLNQIITNYCEKNERCRPRKKIQNTTLSSNVKLTYTFGLNYAVKGFKFIMSQEDCNCTALYLQISKQEMLAIVGFWNGGRATAIRPRRSSSDGCFGRIGN